MSKIRYYQVWPRVDGHDVASNGRVIAAHNPDEAATKFAEFIDIHDSIEDWLENEKFPLNIREKGSTKTVFANVEVEWEPIFTAQIQEHLS